MLIQSDLNTAPCLQLLRDYPNKWLSQYIIFCFPLILTEQEFWVGVGGACWPIPVPVGRRLILPS